MILFFDFILKLWSAPILYIKLQLMIYSQEAVYRLLVKNAEMLHTLTYLTAIKLKNDAIFPEDGCLKKKSVMCFLWVMLVFIAHL